MHRSEGGNWHCPVCGMLWPDSSEEKPELLVFGGWTVLDAGDPDEKLPMRLVGTGTLSGLDANTLPEQVEFQVAGIINEVRLKRRGG